ncbi:MAG: amidohydrolase [Lautropia sp.]
MLEPAEEPGVVDAHFHVIAAPHRYPMLAARSYTPPPASLSDWQATLAAHGVNHGVVVQPSFYGTDNRVLLDTLALGQGRLVGIAAVDAAVTDAELDRLADAGVRGVRMAHFEAGDPRALGGFVPFGAFDALQPRLLERGLHLQLFTDARLLPAIADRIRNARVPVVIDHMGRAPAELGATHAGIRTLVDLMQDGGVWVKLSGIANVSHAAPDYPDARRVHDVLVDAAPDRLVWGSDWPHTRRDGPPPDTVALLRLFIAWTPERHRRAIGFDNAVSLYRLPQA